MIYLKMDSRLEKFSATMKKLLSEDNRDKLLGEISEDIEESIMTVKDMIDSGEITYEEMKQELTKNLNVNTLHRPGSVAQMLVGCTSEDSCPMKQEELLDIPYFYDNYEDIFIPITRADSPISDNSFAVVYITGDYKDLGKDKLKELFSKGFKKVKIMHKTDTRARYNIKVIDDLDGYLKAKSVDYSKYTVGIGATVLALVLLFFVIKYLRKS